MKYSVIIPSCNNGKWLGKCLESIINQTYQNFEIIVVDDLSTDNSVEVAKKYLREQDKLIINSSKRLNGGTRNVGILEAKGEYIICIDSDDWLYDNKVFEKINNKLKDEDLLFMSYIAHSNNGDMLVNLHYKDLKSSIMSGTCAIWTKVVKRELMLKSLFPEGTLFEDRIQHFNLLNQAKTFTNLDEVGIVWNRTNTNTISQNMTKEWITYRFNYCGDLYRLIRNINDIELKKYFIDELKGFQKTTNEMVDEL